MEAMGTIFSLLNDNRWDFNIYLFLQMSSTQVILRTVTINNQNQLVLVVLSTRINIHCIWPRSDVRVKG